MGELIFELIAGVILSLVPGYYTLRMFKKYKDYRRHKINGVAKILTLRVAYSTSPSPGSAAISKEYTPDDVLYNGEVVSLYPDDNKNPKLLRHLDENGLREHGLDRHINKLGKEIKVRENTKTGSLIERMSFFQILFEHIFIAMSCFVCLIAVAGTIATVFDLVGKLFS